MRKLMENQLSWLALLMTAFYSLLASCRGEKCGQEELATCARPLKKIDNGFIFKKEELQQLCLDLEAALNCIKKYTVNCMKENEREHFYSLYAGTNQVIVELCNDTPYQDEFLRHAPCMEKMKSDYELCFRRYEKITQEISRNGTQDALKSVCCGFNEYLDCCEHVVRRKCGEESAKFTKKVLDRMSSPLQKSHCIQFDNGGCLVGSGSVSGATWNIEMLVSAMLIFLGRYFT